MKTFKVTALAFIAAIALAIGLGPTQALAAGPDSAGHGHNPSEDFNWTDLGYKDKDASGGTLEDGEKSMSPPFLLLIMNFAVVLFIIGWKMAPPVKKYAKQRHMSIKEALEEASLLREAAAAKLAEYEEQASRVEADVDKMLKDIRTSAAAEKDRIMKDAEEKAKALEREAEKRISDEIAHARAAIEREVISAAVLAAERLIREHATADDQTKLIEGFIGDMKSEVEAQRAPKESS